MLYLGWNVATAALQEPLVHVSRDHVNPTLARNTTGVPIRGIVFSAKKGARNRLQRKLTGQTLSPSIPV